MTITHQSYDSVEVIALPNRVSMAEATQIRAQIQQLIEQGREHLVLDLHQVEFMDSSGLSILLSARKSVTQKNGSVVLLNLTREARALIELTRLHEVFEIYSDKNAAIARFN